MDSSSEYNYHRKEQSPFEKNNHRQRSRTRHKKKSKKHDKSDHNSIHKSHKKKSKRSNKSKRKKEKRVGSVKRSSSHFRRRKTPHFDLDNEKIGSYEIISHLADGTFGRCFKVRSKKGEYYAAKVIKPVRKYIESAKDEVMLLETINEKDLQGKYAPTLVHCFSYDGHYVIVTSLHGCSLYKLLRRNKYIGFPLPVVQRFSREIIEAVSFLHKSEITHTDLKPENIILTKESRMKRFKYQNKKYRLPQNFSLKLIDFGNAVFPTDFGTGTINTRQFRAPEVILKPYKWNEKSDVWGVGCILMELYTGELFFQTNSTYEHLAMIEKVSGPIPEEMVVKSRLNEVWNMFTDDPQFVKDNGTMLKWPDNVDSTSSIRAVDDMRTLDEIIPSTHFEFKDLIKKLLTVDPKQRISMDDALKHPFFNHLMEENVSYFFEQVFKAFEKSED